MTLIELPHEILRLVLLNCNTSDLLILQTVCKKLKSIVPYSYRYINLNDKSIRRLNNIKYVMIVERDSYGYDQLNTIIQHADCVIVNYSDNIAFMDKIKTFDRIYVEDDADILEELSKYNKPITVIHSSLMLVKDDILCKHYHLLRDCVIVRFRINNELYICDIKFITKMRIYDFEFIEISKTPRVEGVYNLRGLEYRITSEKRNNIYIISKIFISSFYDDIYIDKYNNVNECAIRKLPPMEYETYAKKIHFHHTYEELLDLNLPNIEFLIIDKNYITRDYMIRILDKFKTLNHIGFYDN